ncbi:hypothetical protein BN2475_120124 [Paraburkholderia ribeironis]|uniref:Uncharacterized protein n=1 Tax=Paraburkholderia ribeironis TaxID=1247936 RepID=A0A1N7RR57_9BURK|nr:hypothetical protein BN2475_120124 [Paraburkholderia ribeironis]
MVLRFGSRRAAPTTQAASGSVQPRRGRRELPARLSRPVGACYTLWLSQSMSRFFRSVASHSLA